MRRAVGWDFQIVRASWVYPSLICSGEGLYGTRIMSNSGCLHPKKVNSLVTIAEKRPPVYGNRIMITPLLRTFGSCAEYVGDSSSGIHSSDFTCVSKG